MIHDRRSFLRVGSLLVCGSVLRPASLFAVGEKTPGVLSFDVTELKLLDFVSSYSSIVRLTGASVLPFSTGEQFRAACLGAGDRFCKSGGRVAADAIQEILRKRKFYFVRGAERGSRHRESFRGRFRETTFGARRQRQRCFCPRCVELRSHREATRRSARSVDRKRTEARKSPRKNAGSAGGGDARDGGRAGCRNL